MTQARSSPVNVGREGRGGILCGRIVIAINNTALGPVRIAIRRDVAGKDHGDGDLIEFGGNQGSGGASDARANDE